MPIYGPGGGALTRPVTPPITTADVDATAIEILSHKNAASGYAGLDSSGLVLAALMGNGRVRMFESFGGAQNQSLALQTTAWNNYLAWANSIGGGICGFGPFKYQHLPGLLDIPSYGGVVGSGWATIIQPDSTVTTHAVGNHISTNGTTDPNGISVLIANFFLDCSQISAGTVNASGLRTVAGTEDGIHIETNPTSGAGGTGGERFSFDNDNNTLVYGVFVWTAPRDGISFTGWGENNVEHCRCYGVGRYGYKPTFDMQLIGNTTGGSGDHGFDLESTSIRLVGNKSWFSGQLTNGAGYRFHAIANGQVQALGCEAQDNKGAAYLVDTCSAPILIIGTADSNSTNSAGATPALDIFTATSVQAIINCSERQSGAPTQLHALRIRSTSNNNQIKLMHKGVNGATVGVPIDTNSDFTTCVTNDIEINGYGGRQVLAAAATMTPDPTAGNQIEIDLSATAITTFNVPAAGTAWPGAEMVFTFVQDATGGRTLSGASANYKPSPASAAVVTAAGAAAAAWTTTANTRTTVTYQCVDGTIWRQKGVGVTGQA